MSFITHAITAAIPLYNAYKTYKGAFFKIPENWESNQLNLSQDSVDFAKKSGVRRENLKLFHRSIPGNIAVSFGNHSIPQSDIAIIIDSSFVTQDPSPENEHARLAANATMRHEYTHIKNNDMFMRPCVTTIASTAAAILGFATLNPLSTLLLTSITSISSNILYSQFMESRADDEAIKHSTKAELQALLNILKQDQASSLKIRRTQGLKARLLISPEGNRRYILSHPSLSSRIAKLEKAISQMS